MGDNEQTNKRFKRTGDINKSVSISNTSFTLRLIDLSADCLNKLFKHLDISDLVILAKANLANHEDLDQAFTAETNATTHPYEACIRDRFLQLGYDDCVTNNPNCVAFERTVFRYFGTLISRARLYYDPDYERHNAMIEQVIIEYGSELSEIGLINADMSAFEAIMKPFEKVTKLIFEDGWLGRSFLEIQKWFPNLESLILNNTKISDRRFIKQEHPNLIEFSMKNKYLCRCYRMNRSVFANNILDNVMSNFHLNFFLNLNPQVKYLALFHDRDDAVFELDIEPHQFLIQINFDLLKLIANTLPQLCYLKLNIQEMRLLHLPTYLTRFSSSLKTLIVEISQTNQLTQLNLVSDELNRLEISVNVLIQDYELLAEFVGRFKSIEHLSIGFQPIPLDDDYLVHMIKGLTNLKVLEISLYKNHFLNDLCYIIKKFDRLHTVRICYCIEIAPEARESFLNFINENYFIKNKNWRGSCIFNVFEFKRLTVSCST